MQIHDHFCSNKTKQHWEIYISLFFKEITLKSRQELLSKTTQLKIFTLALEEYLMRLIALIFSAFLISGCASKQQNELAPFTPRTYNPTPEQKQKFAKVKLKYERYGLRESNSMSTTMYHLVGSDPEAAKFFLDKNIAARVDANLHRNLHSQALETLIYTEEFTPYLSEYWAWLYRPTKSVDWFDLDFAISATVWVAEHGNKNERLYAKKQLINYYQTGCKSYAMAKKSETFINLIAPSCIPKPQEMKVWFYSLVKDKEISQSEKFSTAYNIAEKYFRSNSYEDAASWYLAALTLSSEDQVKKIQIDSMLTIETLLYSGLPIETAIERADAILVNAYNGRVATAKKRVNLIAQTGVKTLPALTELQ